MAFTWLLDSWPLVRQFREGDPLGLGRSVQSSRSSALRPRIAKADKVVQSVCPFCAVGCGQLVYVKDGTVSQIEGDPASPISRGRLCPKGAASKNMHAGPLREYKVKYRRPYGTDVGGSAARAGDGHDRRPRDQDARRRPGRSRRRTASPARRTLGIANLGGATLDNEENYLMKKLFIGARRRAGREPGPNMTQLDGARSGHLVRTRRRDDVPAGSAELPTAS